MRILTKAMCLAISFLLIGASAMAYGSQHVHYEDPEPSSAAAAANCLAAPQEIEFLFWFGIRRPDGGSAADARKHITEEEVFTKGVPSVVLVGPYEGLDQRSCMIVRPAAAADLQIDGKQTPALMRGTDGVTRAWAIRSLGKGEQPDTYRFLVAGPVVLQKP